MCPSYECDSNQILLTHNDKPLSLPITPPQHNTTACDTVQATTPPRSNRMSRLSLTGGKMGLSTLSGRKGGGQFIFSKLRVSRDSLFNWQLPSRKNIFLPSPPWPINNSIVLSRKHVQGATITRLTGSACLWLLSMCHRSILAAVLEPETCRRPRNGTVSLLRPQCPHPVIAFCIR